MKVRHYLAVVLATLIINGVTISSCYSSVPRCDYLRPVTCEPQ